MKLYKTKAPDQPIVWAGSQAEAAKDKNRLWDEAKARDDGTKRADIVITSVDISTKKDELISFLNQAQAI